MSALHELLLGKKTCDGKIDLYDHIAKVKETSEQWLAGIGKNGIEHARRLEDHLNCLIPDEFKKQLKPAEIFILLYAVYLHDIGYRREDGNIDAYKHPERSRTYIIENPDKYLFDQFPRMWKRRLVKTAELVAMICYGHAPESLLPLRDISNNDGDEYLSPHNLLNLRRLAALLRLADEMDQAYIREGAVETVRDHISLIEIIPGKITLRWTGDEKAGQKIKEAVVKINEILGPVNDCLSEWNGFPRTHVVQEPPIRSTSAQSALTKEYLNDANVIRTIFTEITTLSKLDYFIQQALYPYLLESVLYEYDVFEKYILSLHFHVYDSTLRELINKFWIAWGEVCQHWESFTPTGVPDKLRPNTWFDVATDEEVETAIKEVPAAAKRMHQSLKELLMYVRNTYKDIGI
jgi:hypothetical protein